MGSLFRSERMNLCQMILEKDTAFSCTGALGQLGVVHFKDMNPTTSVNQRNFSKKVRQCGAAEESLHYIQNQIVDTSIDIPEVDFDNFEIPNPRSLGNLETTIAESAKRFEQIKVGEAQLRKSLNEMCEYKHVLLKVNDFFDDNMDSEAWIEMNQRDPENTKELPLLQSEETYCTRYVAGVLDFHKKSAFERCIWRSSYRHAYVRTAEIEPYFDDPFTGEQKKLCVFVVFINSNKIEEILKRICEGFEARIYPCARTKLERRQAVFSTAARMKDLKFVIDSSTRHRNNDLTEISRLFPVWRRDVHVLKSIYHTMNLYKSDSSGKFFVAECWIAENDVAEVREVLQNAAMKAGSSIQPVVNVMDSGSETPPTYNKINKYTEVFQNIVDSYGVATYGEINPASYTIITFPFLFSLMFGDCGHGFIMLLAGLYFVWKEKSFKKEKRGEILDTFFSGRYIIVLMGLFSIYAGFVYNDAFSKSFNLFGSHWRIPYNSSEIDSWDPSTRITLNPEFAFKHEDGSYFYGVDPIWNVAQNRLSFLNSMKMKLSVIIGIAQMSFGVALSALNHRYFKSSVGFFTCFIPQMVFLLAIFGYLCVQIIGKWLFFWVKPATIFGNFYPGSYCAPSLLVGLIDMFLMKTKPEGFVKFVNGTDGVQTYEELPACSLNKWYPSQATVELHLILIAAICIPIMLLGRPIVFLWHQRTMRKAKLRVQSDELVEAQELLELHPSDPSPSEGDVHVETFGDVFVDQAIHTIEFTLGCISHTASYLRLWALSLAHQQLSEVLWEKTVGHAFSLDGFAAPIFLFVFFFAFSALTIGALVMMEGLSAFLHALRLHWVEFQSKFYGGLGHAFIPFSFKSVLNEID